MPIKWAKSALQSVDEIAGLIAKDNLTLATRFVQELLGAVSKLQAHSSSGWAGRAPGARKLALHKKIIAICRVRGDDVEIWRLLHVALNL